VKPSPVKKPVNPNPNPNQLSSSTTSQSTESSEGQVKQEGTEQPTLTTQKSQGQILNPNQVKPSPIKKPLNPNSNPNPTLSTASTEDGQVKQGST
jgi:hypothetical protein